MNERMQTPVLSPDRSILDVQQAQLLYDRARSSALTVFAIVIIFSAMLTFSVSWLAVTAWFVAASLMIGLTLVLPANYRRQGITLANARDYLWWHTLISSLTGIVWGVSVILLTDVENLFSIFTTAMMVLGVTLGGVSPQSAYRRSYVALATCVLLPYGLYLLLWGVWPISLTGAGILMGYAFFMSASARVELATRDALAVQQQKALMTELQAQRDELQKVSEDKTRFLAATSHDLAQPLHAQGFFIAALKEKLTAPDQITLLTKVEESWRGLGNLLDGLVDVSRLDAGAIVAERRHFDLYALATRIAGEFSAQAKAKGISLEVDGDPAFVETDPILFARIVRNLLSNAIKFTGRGGRIHLEVARTPEAVKITVSDTGCGIPEASQEKIFREYVQLGNQERNREKGLGLGLSIVRRLTALLDIELTLASEVGKGSAFSLHVPSTQEDQKGGVQEKGMDKSQANSVGNLCVLIVDDEDAIRSGMSTLLSSWGCQVFSAASGAEIIQMLGTECATPDVLFIDRRLRGGESGLEIIERVRDELNEDIPAILMTGDIATESFDTAGLKRLHKPVEPNIVRELLSEVAIEKSRREELPS